MAYNNTGLLVAICILIGMILVCHTMNFVYPRNNNKFGDIPVPTKYNIISYDNELGKIPCDSQAQLPCKVLQQQQSQCSNPSLISKLSDSEIALLYKEAYERAGEEVLIRTLQEMQTPKPKPKY
jgi:hypothetical protein